MLHVLRIKRNFFGKFFKYSVELNDFVELQLPDGRIFLRLLGKFYTLMYVKRSVYRLMLPSLIGDAGIWTIK